MTGEGAIAIYREATGLGGLAATSATALSYDTVVLESDTDTIEKNGSTPYSTFQLKRVGYYIVIHNLAWESSGGSNRSEIMTKLYQDTRVSEYGQAHGYIRRSEGCNEGYNHGGTIIYQGSSEPLTVAYNRSDNNSAATARERAGMSSLTIVYLGDSLEMCRLDMASSAQSSSGSWAGVNWDHQDEIDTNAFTHSASSNKDEITLKRANRLYLFFVNAGWNNISSTRSHVHVRATLAGTALEHSYGSSYARGSTNSCTNGETVQMFLVDNGTANQILKIEVIDEGNSCSVVTARSGLSAICLPAAAEAILLHDSAGGTSVDTAGVAIPFDTEDREDAAAFEHVASPNDDVKMKKDGGDYLFMAAIRETRVSGANRFGTLIKWRDGSTAYTRGSFGMYNRGSSTYKAASTGALVLPSITLNDIIDLYLQDESLSSGTAPALEADCSGLCGLLLDSLFTSEDTVGRLVDGGLIGAGDVGGRLCA